MEMGKDDTERWKDASSIDNERKEEGQDRTIFVLKKKQLIK